MNPRTLIDLISRALETPREHVLKERLPGRQWEETGTKRLCERLSAVAGALRAAGVARGDRVGIFSENRVDWLVCDYGILFAGAVSVPIYATLADDQLAFIVREAQIRLLFTQTQAQAEQIHGACGAGVRVITFEGDHEDSLRRFEACGASRAANDAAALRHAAPPTAPSDLAVLIYTSGTTSEPKGVMLTHGNLTSNVVDGFTPIRHDLRPGDVAFSVLPLAHIFEHTVALGYLYLGLTHVVSRPERLIQDIKQTRPHIVAFVPRIFERILTGVLSRSRAAGGLDAALVPWALSVARDHAHARAEGRSPSALRVVGYALARVLVLRKVKAALGLDRVWQITSGSASLQRDTALTFAGMGIPICEGYGLTETSPVVTVNRVRSIRYGSVGRPIPNVEVRIAHDGEILVRGPNVMRGYYRRDAGTAFLDEGWFLTGDIGRLDEQGYLWIVDRKNELFKTGAGKWVSPARVEAAIKRSPYIGQALLVGFGRPHPVALIAPNWDLVRCECGLAENAKTQDIAALETVRSRISTEVLRMTADLEPYERVRRVALLPGDLTLEDGELSPTLKVKRRVVEAHYAKLIDAVYAERP